MTRDEPDEGARWASERGEAVLSVFKRGAEFTKQLLSENEVLRNQLRDLNDRQHSAAQDPEQWERLRHEFKDRIATLEVENQTIRSQLDEVEGESQQRAERYIEIEEENNNLANLYVASYQLHATLDASEVLNVVIEIVINLIGAGIFSVYIYDEKTDRLEPVASEGRSLTEFPRVEIGHGFVGESIASREVVAREPTSSSGKTPMVCIPLQLDERPVGAIVIYSLLQQKSFFSPLDHELFRLLAGHASTAIFASRLHSQSKRKLNTIEGFIELLTL